MLIGLLTTSEDDDPVEGEGLDDPVEEDIDGADDTCQETSARSSGTLKRHLTDKHGDKVSSNPGHTYQTTLSATKKGIGHSSTVSSSQLTAAHQVTLNMLFLKLMIITGIPFRLAENPHLLELLQFLNNSTSLWSRFTYRNVALDVFSTMRGAVKNMLQEVTSRMSFTTDMWTSIAGDSYIDITAHRIDNEWTLKKIVLAVRVIPHPHDAASIADTLLGEFNWYNILPKIISATTDNGSNVIAGIKQLGGHMSSLHIKFLVFDVRHTPLTSSSKRGSSISIVSFPKCEASLPS
ncbi:hypothetical protein PsorP6_016488 [Peronosclerospora sorghi]|uniref:Uncharacterized protein n=1 Tax=Peronosclerospora sorghi TaxID=230839 RepID=A0ACC0VIT0_9STRA|nr:hypothetical protein PsorP6_016488 [Peronosclerospora sorghi]